MNGHVNIDALHMHILIIRMGIANSGDKLPLFVRRDNGPCIGLQKLTKDLLSEIQVKQLTAIVVQSI